MIELFNIIFVESPTGLSLILAFGLGAIIYTLLTDGVKQDSIGIMYNTILYIGLTLIAIGFVGWMVSICMEAHYERKLFELNERLRKDEQWRNAQKRDETGSQERALF